MASLEGVMHGLYLLWWVQEKHMSPAVVASMMAAGDLLIMLLEIPTGWFADRFGHRRSLILGSFVQAVAMLLCWLGEGVPGLLAANVLVAVGDAFRSGADHALLYRTCVALDREPDFQTLQSRTEAIRLTSLVGLILGGGVIVATWGFAAGWIAETALATVGLAMACAMIEPPPAIALSDESESASAAPNRVPFRVLFGLMMPVALLGNTASIGSFLAQTTGHGRATGMTVLVAVVTLAEALGSGVAMRATGAGVRMLRALFAAGALCVVVAASVPSAFLAMVVTLAFLDGIAHSVRAGAIQRAVPDHVRARAASVASACDQVFRLIALPIAGVWQTLRR